MTAYNSGDSPRAILENYGFHINVIGERRIWSISQHIHSEYQKHGEFRERYGPHITSRTIKSSNQPLTEKEAIQHLQHEIDYLKQEMELLKKFPQSEIHGSRCSAHERFFLCF